MGLRILTVAWKQKESLLSIFSENWTHIFKSRKSEKPCMDYWAKKIRKIAPKHVQNTFGHFWKRLRAISEFWCFFDCFENFRRLDHPWNTGRNCFSEKSPQNMFKASFDKIGNDFGHFWIFEKFWIFRKFSMTPWNTEQKNFSKKSCPKTRLDTREQFWAFMELWTFFDFFSRFLSKSLPQKINPENWTQIFQVRKTELIFLCSGIWTQYFKSRKSETELRILTVALNQKKWLLSVVSENWIHFFKSGKLNSYF